MNATTPPSAILTPPIITATTGGDPNTTQYDKYAVYPDAYVIERVWFYVIGVAGTVLGCLGLGCNFLSLGILLHRDMRSSNATLYLIVLVIYDIVFLAFNTTFVSVEYFYYGVTGQADWYDAYVQPTMPIANAFMNVSVTASAYTTITLSIDRSIGVKRPFQWASVCTRRRVQLVLVGVFIWACLLNVPLMMEHRLEWQTTQDSNETILMSVASEYSLTFFHTTVYLKYVNPILDAALPVLAIAAVNAIIGLALRHRQQVSTAFNASGRVSDQAGKDTRRITLQVIFISIFTLISRALRVSTFLVMEYHGTVIVNFCPLYCGTLAAVSHFWNILNSTVNFFLYCYFGQKFRKCFVQVYGCTKCYKASKCYFKGRHNVYSLRSRSSSAFTVSSATSTSTSNRTVSSNASMSFPHDGVDP